MLGWFGGSSCFCWHIQTGSTWGSGLHERAGRTILCKTKVILTSFLYSGIWGLKSLSSEQQHPVHTHINSFPKENNMSSPCYSTIIQTILSSENNEETSPKFISWKSHHLVEWVFKQCLSSDTDLDVTWHSVTVDKMTVNPSENHIPSCDMGQNWYTDILKCNVYCQLHQICSI